MTVSYQYDVASSSSGGFTRLLFKWKGSVYKLVWRELLWFSFAYTLLSVMYRKVLTEDQKRQFERVADYFDKFLGHIPLSFVLGVYVTLVVQRWWQQFLAIPWPDKLCHCIALYVTGNDEPARLVRRTIARYLNLSLVLVLRSISMAVKKRFPTLQHLVEGVPSSEFNTYWIPCTWVIHLIQEARKSKMIVDSQGLKLLVEEFNEFRSKCGLLWSYDWVSIPLVYTQVVTLATYSFFAACVIGRQYVEAITDDDKLRYIDLYIPIFTFLQFFFYMGLLKVAEALINPFGDDDEDFELNWLVDRHLKVSYLVVDTLLTRIPPLVRDAHYDELEPTLTYTKASMMYKKKTFRGSVAAVLVPEDEQTLVLPEIVEEDEESNEHSSDLSLTKTSNSILNLLTWSASTGSKMMSSHSKRVYSEEGGGRLPKSPSFSEDGVSAMESGRLQPPPFHPDPAAAVAARYPTSAGIRGKFISTYLGSSEALLSHKVVVPDPSLYAVGVSSKVDKFRGKLIRGDSGDSTSTNSSSHMDVANCGPTPSTSHGLGSSTKTRKSKSIDMGQVTIDNGNDKNGNNKSNRSRSCAARLRDLKRKYNRKKSQPPPTAAVSTPPARARHRLWRSKESLQKLQEIEVQQITISNSDAQVVPLPPNALSLSLPSIHIATAVEEDSGAAVEGTSPSQSNESCGDDEMNNPITVSNNGVENCNKTKSSNLQLSDEPSMTPTVQK